MIRRRGSVETVIRREKEREMMSKVRKRVTTCCRAGLGQSARDRRRPGENPRKSQSIKSTWGPFQPTRHRRPSTTHAFSRPSSDLTLWWPQPTTWRQAPGESAMMCFLVKGVNPSMAARVPRQGTDHSPSKAQRWQGVPRRNHDGHTYHHRLPYPLFSQKGRVRHRRW